MNYSTVIALGLILFFILPQGRPVIAILGLAIAIFMALRIIG